MEIEHLAHSPNLAVMNTAVSGGPRTLLRLEGLAVLVSGVVAYRKLDEPWLLFAVLFLTPDVTMAGYLLGSRIGATTYNLGHTYVAPIMLAGLMTLGLVPAQWGLCVIWCSHIGFDRALGYGLKFSSAFQATHLGSLKKPALED
jgi:hypothetical protein